MQLAVYRPLRADTYAHAHTHGDTHTYSHTHGDADTHAEPVTAGPTQGYRIRDGCVVH